MPYFLDANNLIGRARRTSRPSEEDAEALIAEVAGRLRQNRARAVLFFDGPAGRRSTSLGSLSVRYPSSGSADAAILREISRSRAPAEIVVVTADRELSRRSRDAGAKWVAPDEFWSRFAARGGRGGTPEKGSGAESRVDVEDWLRYFDLPESER
ncbi:MAG: NYN domain-containing protein [Thermoanaerobaculia bacterium]|nr:NYN domain-containing protein [Thermoanaerobaculia bacterium]